MANTLINIPVIEKVIGAELPNKLRFAPLAVVDNTLEGVAGNTIQRAKYEYIGDAEDVEPGQPIPVADLKQNKTEVKIKKAGKGIELTAEDIKIRGEKELVDTTKDQLQKSVLNKVDSDAFKALCTTKLVVGDGTAPISYASIVDARGLFEDEDDEKAVLFISPSQKVAILKDPQFLPKKDMADEMVLGGTIGEIGGCQVVVAKKLDTLAENGIISNLIVKEKALGIELGKAPAIKIDESAKNDIVGYFITEMYATYLKNESRCVKLLSKSTATKKTK